MKFHQIDTPSWGPDDCRNQGAAQVQLVDASNGAVLQALQGLHKGNVWSAWVAPNNGSTASMLNVSYTTNGCPHTFADPLHVLCGASCSWGAYPMTPAAATGAVVEGYQYKRSVQGANTVWPLRFPGQYYDDESDFMQNWNRFYDPMVGRYLETEPVLEDGEEVAAFLSAGITLPSYAYASSNPLLLLDDSGLWPWGAPYEKEPREQLPDTLSILVPTLTKDEANQLSKDAIDKIGYRDLPSAKKIFDLKPKRMVDLPVDSQQWLKDFVQN